MNLKRTIDGGECDAVVGGKHATGSALRPCSLPCLPLSAVGPSFLRRAAAGGIIGRITDL